MRFLWISFAGIFFVLAACSESATGVSGESCKRILSIPVSTRGDTLVTATGLRYIQLAQGSGSAVAATCRQVTVHYTGYLLDGTQFDTSRERGPFSFTLGTGRAIAGFDQGITGMKVGDKRRLIIPPQLGYGAQGQGSIPPNATLVFDVELVALN